MQAEWTPGHIDLVYVRKENSFDILLSQNQTSDFSENHLMYGKLSTDSADFWKLA